MSALAPFKRLILRAVLRNVSPLVIRIIPVPDYCRIAKFGLTAVVFEVLVGQTGRLGKKGPLRKWAPDAIG
jgi:hypothetical protein